MPLDRGSVLFLHKRTVHSSLPNVSEEVRWSFDLRYNPTGEPTGRHLFPGFVARSRANPETELRDPERFGPSSGWIPASGCPRSTKTGKMTCSSVAGATSTPTAPEQAHPPYLLSITER